MTMTKQQDMWAGEFGDEYTNRNGRSVAEMRQTDDGKAWEAMRLDFLSDLPKDLSILEVGANLGLTLMALKADGFTNLKGVEINKYAIEEGKKLHDFEVVEGSALSLPFPDDSFDLVFTSGVLIHISPDDIGKVIKEMCRVSKRYIFGFEYYAPELTPITYQGQEDRLWKTDFCALFPARVLKEKRYTIGKNIYQMYLLEV